MADLSKHASKICTYIKLFLLSYHTISETSLCKWEWIYDLGWCYISRRNDFIIKLKKQLVLWEKRQQQLQLRSWEKYLFGMLQSSSQMTNFGNLTKHFCIRTLLQVSVPAWFQSIAANKGVLMTLARYDMMVLSRLHISWLMFL